MMFLFAIFIVVQTYPDLLNTCAPIKHGVMQKYPKPAYRLTIRNGSYFPEMVNTSIVIAFGYLKVKQYCINMEEKL